MPLMNQTDYASHRGVTKQAINGLIRDGRIPFVETADGSKLIDSDAADKAMDEHRALRLQALATGSLANQDAGRKPFQNPDGLVKAKTATEVYSARLKQLEYEERIGHLVRVDDLTRSMERCAELVVRDLDRIALRAEDLAAAFTAGGIPALRAALKGVARDIRRTLADNMRVIASEQPAPAESEAETE